MIVPSCRDVAYYISSGTWDEAPWHHRILLRLHFVACYVCRRYSRQMRFINAGVRQSMKCSVNPEKTSALKQKLRQKLTER